MNLILFTAKMGLPIVQDMVRALQWYSVCKHFTANQAAGISVEMSCSLSITELKFPILQNCNWILLQYNFYINNRTYAIWYVIIAVGYADSLVILTK